MFLSGIAVVSAVNKYELNLAGKWANLWAEAWENN